MVDETEEEALRDKIIDAGQLCGCTCDSAHDLLRVIMAGTGPGAGSGAIDINTTKKAIEAEPMAAAELIHSWLDALGLTDHGSSCRFCWRSKKGDDLFELLTQPERDG